MDPERIGPYIIDHKIGSGGMGTVYLAQHAETGEEAAVKVLPPALAHEEGFVARFEREIDALRKLVNPQIVSLLDSGVDDSTYFYAMEYVEGETLTDRLRREKRLPWREVVDYSIQICSALKSAHDAGIIHRDLKPSNLLVDKNNNIKLTDFGVAQVFAASRLTMTGGIIGTAEYMSPEQAFGKRSTKKSDLYSLGVVMYTMLTGRPPFMGKTTLDVIHKHKFGTFDRPSRYVEGIPRLLEETVCQLLEKDPDKRFPDAVVLSRRLEDILRRADVANQEETRAANASSKSNGQSASVHVAEEPAEPGDVAGGTLMRDLVRAEIEESTAGSPVSNFFNNTWVLVLLFVLVVAGGVAWFQMVDRTRSEESPNEKRTEELATFRTTRTKLETYLKSHALDSTDVILRQAITALQGEDAAKAKRLLVGLQVFIEGQKDYADLNKTVGKAIEQINEIEAARTAEKVPTDLPTQLLNQAEKLRKLKEPQKADQVLTMLIEVYQDDPDFQLEVETAKNRLGKPSGKATGD